MFSFFPEDGTVCLMNIDFDHAHAFKLHLPGEVRDVVLGPSEFQKFSFRKNGHDHTKHER
jgi:hypothetical protein